MELTRKQVIDLLEKADSTVYKEPKTKLAQALEYAISSIKTDEAYQIMYEGGEIFTKDDMVAMLTELSMKIGEIEDGYVEFDEENERCLSMIPLESIERLIDGEINSLKEA